MHEKHCGKCNTTKPLGEFNAHAVRGTQTYCRPCQRHYLRAYWHANKAALTRRQRVLREVLTAQNAQTIYDHLLAHPCCDCGEADPIVLDFDHVRGAKRGHVSDAVSHAWSRERLQSEIAKCDIRCANCHRRKTARERNSWRHQRRVA